MKVKEAKWVRNKIAKSLEKLIAQGKQSSINGECLYRGPTGLKCAIGHMIPNKNYKRTMDALGGGLDADSLLFNYPNCLGNKFKVTDSSWFEEFQVIHDTSIYPSTFVTDVKRKTTDLLKRLDWEITRAIKTKTDVRCLYDLI